jgi:hypothetical protein
MAVDRSRGEAVPPRIRHRLGGIRHRLGGSMLVDMSHNFLEMVLFGWEIGRSPFRDPRKCDRLYTEKTPVSRCRLSMA